MKAAVAERAQTLTRVPLTRMAVSDLELLAVGAFSPLTGFMTRADYEGAVKDARLSNGLPWTIPVVLPVEDGVAAQVKEGQEVAFTCPKMVALLGSISLGMGCRTQRWEKLQLQWLQAIPIVFMPLLNLRTESYGGLMMGVKTGN